MEMRWPGRISQNAFFLSSWQTSTWKTRPRLDCGTGSSLRAPGSRSSTASAASKYFRCSGARNKLTFTGARSLFSISMQRAAGSSKRLATCSPPSMHTKLSADPGHTRAQPKAFSTCPAGPYPNSKRTMFRSVVSSPSFALASPSSGTWMRATSVGSTVTPGASASGSERPCEMACIMGCASASLLTVLDMKESSSALTCTVMRRAVRLWMSTTPWWPPPAQPASTTAALDGGSQPRCRRSGCSGTPVGCSTAMWPPAASPSSQVMPIRTAPHSVAPGTAMASTVVVSNARAVVSILSNTDFGLKSWLLAPLAASSTFRHCRSRRSCRSAADRSSRYISRSRRTVSSGSRLPP
mmetsp:Transcript_22730/g.63618  ORF Transcript_22730/g.63618 Transcript_22730/m.63618 type:complete len:353 (-) Transcript_22730:29-1087(-)